MKAVFSSVAPFRANLLRCLILLGLGVAIVVLTRQAVVEAADRQMREAERQATLRTEIDALAGGASQTEPGKAFYRDMTARGMLGPEHRLDWVQRVSQLKEARRLAEMEYELAPRQAAVDAGALPLRAGRYEFRTSTMKLRMGLLHEGDLLDLLDELAEPVSAMPRVRFCRIERLPDPSATARLSASCSIDWITLEEKP